MQRQMFVNEREHVCEWHGERHISGTFHRVDTCMAAASAGTRHRSTGRGLSPRPLGYARRSLQLNLFTRIPQPLGQHHFRQLRMRLSQVTGLPTSGLRTASRSTAASERPQAALENALRECLAHARQAPHLVMRVNEGAVETAEALVRRLAQETGFAGRLVVLGEPDIAPGDGRIEWAEGGFVIERERLGQLVDQAVATAFPGFRPPAE